MYQRFKTNILVRDKRVEEMKSAGIVVDYKKLNQADYIRALRKKVIEEAQEVAEEENRDKLVYELADLREVVQALTNALEITDSEISEAQEKKREKAGGFTQKYFTNFVVIENDNPIIEYYLQRPNKYPKIK
ncbi:MAG: nucleoside triphosphate pyrophosphohydrolase [Alphaproteobacteria bacterium]|nr:nucleoside triphosphate pyrophosphohydrolase [Alphaproteobacteria bacterium]